MPISLPPAELRVGMGPFEDPDVFLRSGRETLDLARRLIDLRSTDDVLDLGCGCGRLAIHLLSHLDESGSYLGIDVDSGCISWCREHVSSLRSDFVFKHLDVRSASYNPEGAAAPEDVAFPAADASIDSAILSSLFTHMAEPGIRRYLAELGRVLRLEGRLLISVFLMNDDARSAIGLAKTLFVFREALGEGSWTLDPSQPLEAVAVSEEWLRETAEQYGLELYKIEYGTWRDRRSWEVDHDWVVLGHRAGEAA